MIHNVVIQQICHDTGLIPEEIEILRKYGVLTARKDNQGNIFFRSDDVEEAVAKFSTILVPCTGLLERFIDYETEDRLYPHIGDLPVAGYAWWEGTPLWRLSDVLEWRKAKNADNIPS